MKFEPPIDHGRLIETVRDVYGFVVEDIAFVPVGYVAVAYSLRCEGNARYFLKLLPDTHAGRDGAARLDAYLPLTRALFERRLYPRVSYPIPTLDGRLWATFAGMPLAVFPYFDGYTPPSWPDWPRAVWEEMARTFAAIHQATPLLVDVLPPREEFDIPFEIDLRRGLTALERIEPGARPGVRALQNLVLPRTHDVLAQLDRLHRLQGTVRRLPDPLVLCHTDMGGDNMLVDDEGSVVVLDWEGATVAPPEHDLQCAVGGGHLARFLEVYFEAGGAPRLHLDHFAFYLLRRYLADMSARLVSILHENTRAEEDEESLYGIDAYGFSPWRALDPTLDDIAAALGQSSSGRT